MFVYKELPSPVGNLTLVASTQGLAAVLWEKERPDRVALTPLRHESEDATLKEAERQLREYFAGARTSFDLPLAPEGTEFQKRVWLELEKIPYGETRSYSQIAANLEHPKAVRAVGAANGRNPLSIIVPCHRVIGSSGRLTGFAGGLEAKAFLIQLEARRSCASPS